MTVGLPKSGSDERRSQPQLFQKTVIPLQSITISAAQTAVRGQVYLQPFEIQQYRTINNFYVNFGAAAGTMRSAIYKDNGLTPIGGQKVWDSGNHGVSGITTATVTYLAAPGLYWLATTYATSGAQIWRAQTSVQWSPWCAASFSYASDFTGIGGPASYTKSTALPTTCPACTLGAAGANFAWVMTVT